MKKPTVTLDFELKNVSRGDSSTTLRGAFLTAPNGVKGRDPNDKIVLNELTGEAAALFLEGGNPRPQGSQYRVTFERID